MPLTIDYVIRKIIWISDIIENEKLKTYNSKINP